MRAPRACLAKSISRPGAIGRTACVAWRARTRSRARSACLRSASSTPPPYLRAAARGGVRRPMTAYAARRAALIAERGREQPLDLGELGRRRRVAADVVEPGVARGRLVVEVVVDPALEVVRLGEPRRRLAGALLGLRGEPHRVGEGGGRGGAAVSGVAQQLADAPERLGAGRDARGGLEPLQRGAGLLQLLVRGADQEHDVGVAR